ncbi:hypothetical protein [Streptomyces inhibens]|uniref:hypothetical protein n=1 Tax=Streptomyces inhibens TaxID=2293571 RepID=UPI001EE6A3D7|nr:hypothetical protein [Streptomyces inhibens]UKY47972.1 hypothetical protein KI385_03505 [Streptomyces inhibens]
MRPPARSSCSTTSIGDLRGVFTSNRGTVLAVLANVKAAEEEMQTSAIPASGDREESIGTPIAPAR